MNRNSNVSQLKQLKTKPNNSAESPTSYHSLWNNRPQNPQSSRSQTSLSPTTVLLISQPSPSTTNNKHGVGSSCGQHQSILPQIPSLQENTNSLRLSTLPLPNSQLILDLMTIPHCPRMMFWPKWMILFYLKVIHH